MTDIPTANARPLIPPSGNNPSVSPRIYSHPHYPSTASPSPHAITCNIPCSRPGKFAGLNGGLRLPAHGIQTRYGIENKQGPREKPSSCRRFAKTLRTSAFVKSKQARYILSVAVGLEDSGFGVDQRSGGLKKSPARARTANALDPARLGFLGILAAFLGHGRD